MRRSRWFVGTPLVWVATAALIAACGSSEMDVNAEAGGQPSSANNADGAGNGGGAEAPASSADPWTDPGSGTGRDHCISRSRGSLAHVGLGDDRRHLLRHSGVAARGSPAPNSIGPHPRHVVARVVGKRRNALPFGFPPKPFDVLGARIAVATASESMA
jgi:hypothetical protein